MNAQKYKLLYRLAIYLPRDKQGPQPRTQTLFFPNLDPMLSLLYLSGIEAAGPLLLE